mmetsp:Transcript_45957/g.103541  ORF Transcript_45957/g.103541 Transcript_45957/m.103541 type:complete len:259 (-) Transcript_45957:257-1033(-)
MRVGFPPSRHLELTHQAHVEEDTLHLTHILPRQPPHEQAHATLATLLVLNPELLGDAPVKLVGVGHAPDLLPGEHWPCLEPALTKSFADLELLPVRRLLSLLLPARLLVPPLGRFGALVCLLHARLRLEPRRLRLLHHLLHALSLFEFVVGAGFRRLLRRLRQFGRLLGPLDLGVFLCDTSASHHRLHMRVHLRNALRPWSGQRLQLHLHLLHPPIRNLRLASFHPLHLALVDPRQPRGAFTSGCRIRSRSACSRCGY